jgi:hypothetical protein
VSALTSNEAMGIHLLFLQGSHWSCGLSQEVRYSNHCRAKRGQVLILERTHGGLADVHDLDVPLFEGQQLRDLCSATSRLGTRLSSQERPAAVISPDGGCIYIRSQQRGQLCVAPLVEFVRGDLARHAGKEVGQLNARIRS